MVIDGKQIALEILSDLKKEPKPKGELVAILAEDNPASEKFLKEKARVAGELGISFYIERPKTEQELLRIINELNRDRGVRGVVLQLPLPSGYDAGKAISAIASKKDVDALGGGKKVLAPTVRVIETILKKYKFSLSGKHVIVLGRGVLVGAPVTEWLKGQVGELDQFHTSHFDFEKLKEADLVISGMGRPGFIRGKDIKKRAFLIDFGYGLIEGKVLGDFDFKTCEAKARAITPTPGGTGPILVAELFRNFFRLRD